MESRTGRMTPREIRESRTIRLADALVSSALIVRGVRQRIATDAGLTLQQWRALWILGRKQCGYSSSDLARALGQRRQQTHRLSVELARTGRVRFMPAPFNRRVLLLDLTPHGSGLLQQVERRYRFWWLMATRELPDWQLAEWARCEEALRMLLARTVDLNVP